MIQRDIASGLGISKGECSKRVRRGMPLDSVESARAWCAARAAASSEGAGHKSHSASVTDSARALTSHAPQSLRAADSTPPSPTDTTPAAAPTEPRTTPARAAAQPPTSPYPKPAATPGGAPDPEPRASGAPTTADAAASAHSSAIAPQHPSTSAPSAQQPQHTRTVPDGASTPAHSHPSTPAPAHEARSSSAPQPTSPPAPSPTSTSAPGAQHTSTTASPSSDVRPPSSAPSDLRSTLPRLTRPHGALDTAPDDPAGTLARMRETEQRSYALIDAALAKAARTTAADDYAALPGLIRSYNQAAANSLAAASAWEKHCRAAGEVAPVEHLVNILDTTLEPLMAQLANLPALVAPKANPAAPAIAEAAIAAELATIRRQIADALYRPVPPAPI